jgi:hypothetical protein
MNAVPAFESPDDHENRIREASEREEVRCTLAVSAATFLLIVGGVAAAGVVIAPMQVAGASQTGRLEWRRREAEIARVVNATESVPTTPMASPSQP